MSMSTILLLGGAQFQVDAILAAKKLGYRTVLCDYLPDNPGQYAADVFYQLSTTDYEAVLGVAKDERIDGVLSFGSDVAAPTAARVAAELGLPGNPIDSVDILSKKHLFRAFLESHGFACPQACSFGLDTPLDEVLLQLSHLHLPIMVKPTDSSGSKGISTIFELSHETVSQAIEFARPFSRNSTLIAEERIASDRPFIVGGDIFVVDGVVQFWGLMRCLRDYRLTGLVPVGKMFPTGLDAQIETRVRAELQRLVTELGFTFGEMNVEVIVGEDGTPYIIELAARAGGNFIPVQLKDVSGIDLTAANVLCAMGRKPEELSFSSGGKNIVSCVLHALHAGTLESVEFSESFASAKYRDIRYFEAGDQVPSFVNASDALGVAFFEFADADEMRRLVAHVEEHVVVKVKGTVSEDAHVH